MLPVQYSFQISPGGISKGETEQQVKKIETGSKQRWERNTKYSLLKSIYMAPSCKFHQAWAPPSAWTSVKSRTGKPTFSGFSVKPESYLDDLSHRKLQCHFSDSSTLPLMSLKVNQQSLQTWSPEKCLSDDCAESTRAVWMESADGLRERPVAPGWASSLTREQPCKLPSTPWSLSKKD